MVLRVGLYRREVGESYTRGEILVPDLESVATRTVARAIGASCG